ncbi:thiamine biosynthesis protein ThiF [Candidatus Poribacteria bacterium]|nr:thiamine biosynthesis protein ThiF [Candidatus Poribacteria bacterium]MYH83269.1 thiamine biosynthesis protein ThiF [Candidatus Poribacteria bacterium]
MWFLKNLARFHKEQEVIAALNSEMDWLLLADWKVDNGKILCLIADIKVPGCCHPLIMLYPTNYPASPPTVRPRQANQHLSTHQYRSGELCLEWGPDTWHEKITGADVLISAHKLLELENPREDDPSQILAPSRHSLTLGQELRFNHWRFIADNPLISYTESLPEKASGTIQFRVVFSRKNVTAFIESFSPLNCEKWYYPTLPPELEKTTHQIEGYFFKTNLTSDALKYQQLDSPLDVLEAENYDVSQLRSLPTSFALLIDASGGLNLFLTSNKKEWNRFAQVDINQEKENSRLLPHFTDLSTKTVGIVGLGSAGSKVAISLARTGIRNFLLVDHDVFLPENICRHELNWEDVGQHKIDGIEHQLKLIAQSVNVKCYHVKLSGQEATLIVDGVLSQLGSCDIIIDATADPCTLNQLSTVASQQLKPMVWLKIYPSGIGGMIARFRPNEDPDPKTTCVALREYLEKLKLPEIQEAANYTTINGGGEIIAASDADVTLIAANATRMALDILVKREPSDFPCSLYLIGLSQGWIFDQPFDTIPIDLSEVQPHITESELSENQVSEALDFIEQLISKQKNEDPSTG